MFNILKRLGRISSIIKVNDIKYINRIIKNVEFSINSKT